MKHFTIIKIIVSKISISNQCPYLKIKIKQAHADEAKSSVNILAQA